ncbi:hypothetical protein CCUS01_11101 [Colletotrichum cuscutae]|uniref:Uncharacterized protein n=1 Tax=Colletotrichum cuscutae TaxID=1209917 RepID=A0AAI9U7A1_9PEZI|nr:hypothetical protein CCUS01_11101 [Colletotrichum cuscutae]
MIRTWKHNHAFHTDTYLTLSSSTPMPTGCFTESSSEAKAKGFLSARMSCVLPCLAAAWWQLAFAHLTSPTYVDTPPPAA